MNRHLKYSPSRFVSSKKIQIFGTYSCPLKRTAKEKSRLFEILDALKYEFGGRVSSTIKKAFKFYEDQVIPSKVKITESLLGKEEKLGAMVKQIMTSDKPYEEKLSMIMDIGTKLEETAKQKDASLADIAYLKSYLDSAIAKQTSQLTSLASTYHETSILKEQLIKEIAHLKSDVQSIVNFGSGLNDHELAELSELNKDVIKINARINGETGEYFHEDIVREMRNEAKGKSQRIQALETKTLRNMPLEQLITKTKNVIDKLAQVPIEDSDISESKQLLQDLVSKYESKGGFNEDNISRLINELYNTNSMCDTLITAAKERNRLDAQAFAEDTAPVKKSITALSELSNRVTALETAMLTSLIQDDAAKLIEQTRQQLSEQQQKLQQEQPKKTQAEEPSNRARSNANAGKLVKTFSSFIPKRGSTSLKHDASSTVDSPTRGRDSSASRSSTSSAATAASDASSHWEGTPTKKWLSVTRRSNTSHSERASRLYSVSSSTDASSTSTAAPSSTSSSPKQSPLDSKPSTPPDSPLNDTASQSPSPKRH